MHAKRTHPSPTHTHINTMTSNLPELQMSYDRQLLNQVKLGKGKAMKQLRDELAERPEIKQRYMRERNVELINAKQKEKMMWTQDANSKVRRVDNDFRDKCTFTNPMHTHQVPQRATVQQAKWKVATRLEEPPSCGSLF